MLRSQGQVAELRVDENALPVVVGAVAQERRDLEHVRGVLPVDGAQSGARPDHQFPAVVDERDGERGAERLQRQRRVRHAVRIARGDLLGEVREVRGRVAGERVAVTGRLGAQAAQPHDLRNALPFELDEHPPEDVVGGSKRGRLDLRRRRVGREADDVRMRGRARAGLDDGQPRSERRQRIVTFARRIQIAGNRGVEMLGDRRLLTKPLPALEHRRTKAGVQDMAPRRPSRTR